MKLFLDTNVLLDVMCENRENHVDSAAILKLAKDGYEEVIVSSQSILDTYYLFSVSQKRPLEEFKVFLGTLLSTVTLASIGEENLKEAIRSSNRDFEDAAQIACAVSCGCDCIISSDVKMKRDSQVRVYTPKEFCDQIFNPWR